jgi:hypothetical protein
MSLKKTTMAAHAEGCHVTKTTEITTTTTTTTTTAATTTPVQLVTKFWTFAAVFHQKCMYSIQLPYLFFIGYYNQGTYERS